MKYSSITFFAFVLFINITLAQVVPIPAPTQTKGIIILGGTAHIGNGQVLENAIIAFDNGVITSIGTDKPTNSSNYEVIDGSRKHIYPGFIAMNTTLGLVDIDAVRATRDFRETGRLNPHVRTLIAYNTDSKIIPTIRSNGTLITQAVPKGSFIAGQSCVMRLDAWNWEDAMINADQGIHLDWPNKFRSTGWRDQSGGIKKNENYEEQVQQIEDFMNEAKAYSEIKHPKSKNLRMEAMRGLFDNSKKLYVKANSVKTMEAAILLCEKLDIPIVIMGGVDAWQITDLLATNKLSVVLNGPQTLPNMNDSHIDQPYKTASQLTNAGIEVAISLGGAGWQNRNLPFQAGQAVAFGLDYEAAIKALTLSPARILNIDKDYGSLEQGKSATLFISEGDALDMRTNKVTKAFIDGRSLDLNNVQEDLAKRFQAKYQQR